MCLVLDYQIEIQFEVSPSAEGCRLFRIRRRDECRSQGLCSAMRHLKRFYHSADKTGALRLATYLFLLLALSKPGVKCSILTIKVKKVVLRDTSVEERSGEMRAKIT